jgi:hypothetical protein
LNTVLLEKLTDSQLLETFCGFYGTRRLVAAFTSACHLSLSGARSIQSIPLPEDPVKMYICLLFYEGMVLKCEILNLWLLELHKIM